MYCKNVKEHLFVANVLIMIGHLMDV